MTVVTSNFTTTREEKTMTATVLELRSTGRHAPSFFDRVVMRASLSTLMWARHRGDRAAASRELRVQRALETRQFACGNHEPFSVTSRQSSPMPR
jgi:hypothetical protein